MKDAPGIYEGQPREDGYTWAVGQRWPPQATGSRAANPAYHRCARCGSSFPPKAVRCPDCRNEHKETGTLASKYREQAKQAAAIVAAWPESIKRNITKEGKRVF